MSAAQRNKGAAGELEVVKILQAAGFADAYRVPMSGAHEKLPGDIGGVPGLHIEVKRAEALRLDEWQAQCVGDCPTEDIPVLVYRRSRNPWRVVLALDDFMDLYGALFE